MQLHPRNAVAQILHHCAPDFRRHPAEGGKEPVDDGRQEIALPIEGLSNLMWCTGLSDDASRFGIGLGDLVEITPPNGRWEGPRWWSIRSGPARCNPRDPVSHQPQLKSSPVAVRRLSFGEPEPWLLQRFAELNGDEREPFAAREYNGTVNRDLDAHRVPLVP